MIYSVVRSSTSEHPTVSITYCILKLTCCNSNLNWSDIDRIAKLLIISPDNCRVRPILPVLSITRIDAIFSPDVHNTSQLISIESPILGSHFDQITLSNEEL